VVIPDVRDEAIRDLSRARQDAVRARLKVRQQLKAMLLRHGKRFAGKTSWGAIHKRHLARRPAPNRPRRAQIGTALQGHHRLVLAAS